MVKSSSFYEKRVFSGEHEESYLIASSIIQRKFNNKKIVYLDVGCSDGYGIKLIKESLNNTVIIPYGIDIRNPKKRKTNFKFKRIDLNSQKIPLKDNSVDVITSFEVVEHIYDTSNYISEIHRVLKPEGIALISTPNLSWWLNRILLLFGYQPANTEVDLYNTMFGKPKLFKNSIGAGHIRVFTNKAFTEFVNFYGFKITKKIAMTNMYGGFIGGVIKMFDKILPLFCDCGYRYIYLLKKRV